MLVSHGISVAALVHHVGTYDHSQPLVIEPILRWNVWSYYKFNRTILMNSDGSVYAVAYTEASSVPRTDVRY